MTKGIPSQADQALADTLNDLGDRIRGKPISAVQVQGWRKSGLIPNVEVSHEGRRGRTSTYPPEVLPHARMVLYLFGRSRLKRDVTATLFALGYFIPDAVIRATLHDVLDVQEVEIEKAAISSNKVAHLTRLTEDNAANLRRTLPAVDTHWKQNALREQTELEDDEPDTGRSDRVSSRTANEGSMVRLIDNLREVEIEVGSTAASLGVADLLAEQLCATDEQMAAALGFRMYSPSELRQRLNTLDPDGLLGVRERMRLTLALLTQQTPPTLPFLNGDRYQFACWVARLMLHLDPPNGDWRDLEPTIRQICEEDDLTWPAYLFEIGVSG